ncbi:MAG: hypothetical protein OHK0021_11640 [Bryobacter sp.]
MGSMVLARTCILAAVLLVAPLAQAAMLQIQGEITSVIGAFSPAFAPGQTFTGFVVLTTASADFDPNANIGLYETTGGSIALSFENGGFQEVDGAATPFTVQVNNVAPNKSLQLAAILNSGLTLELTFNGNSSFLGSDLFPTDPNAINTSGFLSGLGTLYDQDSVDLKGEDGDRVNFSITGVTAVPEPSTYLLTGIGIIAIAWRRRR